MPVKFSFKVSVVIAIALICGPTLAATVEPSIVGSQSTSDPSVYDADSLPVVQPETVTVKSDIIADGDNGIERLVVTAAQQQRPWLSSSAAINSRDFSNDAPALDIASLLQGLPGVQADQRANFAQDSRISLRGFGSRSSFGVRGIEVLLDGVPWSTADGQSQPGSMMLSQLAGVEVLRGPFAALYGNSAGGVLALKSKPITPAAIRFQQLSGNLLQQQQLQISSGQTELS
ncbi:MAG: TonB-dependent receptor plug domain-containing protein, partial [Gammaproteobacteria bacterium]|nr:TonB-dependent receptor plug domain-containing protein [Gammaproteobacteria bacterium]